MREYYRTCMDTSALNHAKMNPLKRITHPLGLMWKESEGLYDGQSGVRGDLRGLTFEFPYADLPMNVLDRKQTAWATARLAKYNLWSFVRMEVKQSLFNSSEMRIRIEPHIDPVLPRPELYEQKDYRDAYQWAAGRALEDLHREQWILYPRPTWNLANTLANEVIEFEHQVVQIQIKGEQRQDDAGNAVVWTRGELEEHIPDLGVHLAVGMMGVEDVDKLDNVEVVHPEYLIRLDQLITRTPRKVVRAYFVLKAFQQTWEMLSGNARHRWSNLMKKTTGMVSKMHLTVEHS